MNKIKTKAQVMRIREMRSAGITTEEIAKVFGVKPRAIFYWVDQMKKQGIDCPTTAKRGGKRIELK